MKIVGRWYLVPFAGCLAANTYASPTMCLNRESAIFDCALKRTVASLCISRTDGRLVYRKGIPGKSELVLNDNRWREGTVFLLSNTQYAGGYESHIRFSNRSITYVIYDRSVKIDDGPETSAGIVVYEKGRQLVNLVCENNASISAEPDEAMRKEDYTAIQKE